MSWPEGDRINAVVWGVITEEHRNAGCPLFLVGDCCAELEAKASQAYRRRDADNLTAALKKLAQHLVGHATSARQRPRVEVGA
jgi:hypothetical protein